MTHETHDSITGRSCSGISGCAYGWQLQGSPGAASWDGSEYGALSEGSCRGSGKDQQGSFLSNRLGRWCPSGQIVPACAGCKASPVAPRNMLFSCCVNCWLGGLHTQATYRKINPHCGGPAHYVEHYMNLSRGMSALFSGSVDNTDTSLCGWRDPYVLP